MPHDVPTPRPRHRRHLLAGLLLAALTWLAEGAALAWVFEGRLLPFDARELSMRALVLVLLVGFSLVVARDVRRLERLEEESRRLNRELATALDHALAGLLPVCAGCKSIRGHDGSWEPIEAYLHERTGVDFTHGLCPCCRERLYPELSATPTDASATARCGRA